MNGVRKWGTSKVVTIALGVTFGVLILACSGGSKTSTSSSDKDSGSIANIGSPVRDGKFEFTVVSVKAGPATVGTPPLGKAP